MIESIAIPDDAEFRRGQTGLVYARYEDGVALCLDGPPFPNIEFWTYDELGVSAEREGTTGQ